MLIIITFWEIGDLLGSIIKYFNGTNEFMRYVLVVDVPVKEEKRYEEKIEIGISKLY